MVRRCRLTFYLLDIRSSDQDKSYWKLKVTYTSEQRGPEREGEREEEREIESDGKSEKENEGE